MALVQFITNMEMDDDTVEDLHTLRNIRIETTRKLLENIDETLENLVELGSISKADVNEEFADSLRVILTNKLRMLTERSNQEQFHDDEIALYSDIEVSSAEDSL